MNAWLQRPLAILFTLSLAFLLPVTYFDLFGAAILLAHYVAAIWFHPWGRIRKSGNLPGHLLLIGILFVIALLQFRFSLPAIELYFGIHFVLTEYYERSKTQVPGNAFFRYAFYSAVYLYFMKYNLNITELARPLLALAVVSYGGMLIRERNWRTLLAEAAFFVPLYFAYQQPMRFSYILTYHVMLWWALPLSQGASGLPRRYWLQAGAIAAFFGALVFGTYFMDESYFWFWRREATRFGYVHVTLSFLMSSLNPAFLRTGFQRLQGIRNVV